MVGHQPPATSYQSPATSRQQPVASSSGDIARSVSLPEIVYYFEKFPREILGCFLHYLDLGSVIKVSGVSSSFQGAFKQEVAPLLNPYYKDLFSCLTQLKQTLPSLSTKIDPLLDGLKSKEVTFFTNEKSEMTLRADLRQANIDLDRLNEVPALIALLGSDNPIIVQRTVDALANIGEREQTLPALIALLGSNNPITVQRTVDALLTIFKES